MLYKRVNFSLLNLPQSLLGCTLAVIVGTFIVTSDGAPSHSSTGCPSVVNPSIPLQIAIAPAVSLPWVIVLIVVQQVVIQPFQGLVVVIILPETVTVAPLHSFLNYKLLSANFNKGT